MHKKKMFKQTVLVFCLFFFSRTVSGDDGTYQQNVDYLISGGLEKAAIIDLDGNTQATSPGFVLLPGEGARLAQLFNKPSDAISNGIFISGTKYMALKGDSRSIYGKNGPFDGVICVKTNTLIMIGVYGSRIVPGQAANIVETLGDYFIKNGF